MPRKRKKKEGYIEKKHKVLRFFFREGRFLRGRGKRWIALFLGILSLYVMVLLGALFYERYLLFYDEVILDRGEYDKELYQEVRTMTKGHPMERMARYIAENDRLTAAYLVAIAKKESNWGKRSPIDSDGTHCYNYWGFRLSSHDRVTPSGYSCFASPSEAIDVVSDRIHQLIYVEGLGDVSDMVVWKCGKSCATHSQASVDKWISDVDFYVRKIMKGV